MSKNPIDEHRRTALKAAAGLGTIGIAGYAGASRGIGGPRDVTVSTTDRLWFAGLEHTALGDATLDTSTGSLVVSNIDSSGDDGVNIAVGETNGFMHTTTLRPSSTPAGAFRTVATTGIVDGTAGQPAGSLETTRLADESGYALQPDFSPLGSDGYTLRAYADDALVFEGGPYEAPTQYRVDIDIDIEICRRGWLDWYIDIEIDITVEKSVVVAPDGNRVEANKIEFEPAGTTATGTLTNVDIVAADISQFEIYDESVEAFGRPHAAVGDAHILPENDGTQLTVDNIDGGGDDGVSVRLDGVERYTATLDPVTFDVTDASLGISATGILDGTPDSSLGTSSLTNTGDRLQATTDFSAVGSDTTRVEVFDNGEKVGETTVPSGDIGVIESIIPIDGCGKLPPNPPCFIWRGPFTATFTASDGTSFVGNDFRFLAADADKTFEGLNSFDIRAANISSFTQVDETTI